TKRRREISMRRHPKRQAAVATGEPEPARSARRANFAVFVTAPGMPCAYMRTEPQTRAKRGDSAGSQVNLGEFGSSRQMINGHFAAGTEYGKLTRVISCADAHRPRRGQLDPRDAADPLGVHVEQHRARVREDC